MAVRTKTSTYIKQKYGENAYVRIILYLRKGRRDQLHQYAKEHNTTANLLINTYIREQLGIPEKEWKTYNNPDYPGSKTER